MRGHLVLVAVALVAVGCTDGTDSDQLIRREAVVNAFQAAGEPVRLDLDMARADPGSPIDSLYSAEDEFETTFGPFEVVMLEAEDSAATHAAHLQALYGPDGSQGVHTHVARNRNVILIVASKVGTARRMRLFAILESLDA